MLIVIGVNPSRRVWTFEMSLTRIQN
ncbi:hypothetical protein CBM2592_B80040 [Cupriavidus taiwanensis]|nr:hypothetical protein CBM2592_B80040 [Cupriavidus taiwanensis]SOY72860.1 hypothetical protein CBM2588_B80038 [Cupriavidus taiwanensis]SOY96799.1 hypothetical protein CBM2591_B60040 [Cupriavidus taiwanensis]SOZ83962.1 hypothetical protein CBM2618_B100041 [Cupriavidus taiwanensis]SOZ86668.1 hypothetical protein CBM2622_B110040 [Cupriavidus taiwanensis]